MPSYNNLRIKGPISVVPITADQQIPFASVWILILGQTGVGKSSFVQAFSKENDLNIAKNTLESVTPEINAYRLVNVTYNGAPISLIDTPGLSDLKISEMRIMHMIWSWMDARNLSGINRMLYFDRIIDLKMTGSKGKCTEIFTSLSGESAASAATIVTTMWDHLTTEKMKMRADDRYKQLQNDSYWKEFIGQGAGIQKFMNDSDSALYILNECLARGGRLWFDFEKIAQRNQNLRDTLLGKNLHRTMRERMQLLQQKFRTIDDDLNHPSSEATAGTELHTILVAHRKETMDSLQDANKDLEDFEREGGDELSPLPSETSSMSVYMYPNEEDSIVNVEPESRGFFRRLKAMFCCSPGSL